MDVMAEERTRVDFNAPATLVERADTIADLLDISRTQLLIEALRNEVDELAADEGFRRRVGDAYYAGQVGFETVEAVLGTEEAMRMTLLRASLDREPPEPRLEGGLPPAEAFYEGEIPEWTPENSGEESSDDGEGDGGESDDGAFNSEEGKDEERGDDGERGDDEEPEDEELGRGGSRT